MGALVGADGDVVVSGLQAEIAIKVQGVERVRGELEAHQHWHLIHHLHSFALRGSVAQHTIRLHA